MRQRGDRPFLNTLTLLGLVLALSAVACGPSPEEVAEKYLTAMAEGDAEEAHKWASPADQAAKSVAELRMEIGEESRTELEKAFGDEETFNILESGKEGETAWVNYSFQRPDYDLMRNDMLLLAKAMRQAGDDKAKERLIYDQLLAEKFKSTPFPVVDGVVTLRLAKAEKKWKLLLGWKEAKEKALAEAARERALAEQKARFDEKMAKFEMARKLQKYMSAFEALKEAEAIAPKEANVEEIKKKLVSEAKAYEKKAPTLKALRVVDVSTNAVKPKRKTDKPYTLVKGTLINDSRKILRVVTVGIDLLDDSGEVLERVFHNPWDMDTIDKSTPRARTPFEPSFRHDFQKRIYQIPDGFSGNARVTVTDYVAKKKKKKKRRSKR